jgi:Zn-dependent protease
LAQKLQKPSQEEANLEKKTRHRRERSTESEAYMFPRMQLGRWFGIPVHIHWTFWLLPLWVILAQPPDLPAGFPLAVLFTMCGCVVLHEFGHAAAARFFGIRTRDVTLYPIGGVARMERMSEKAGEEFVIAIAGPLVNVVIAALLGIGMAMGHLVAPGLLSDSLGALFVHTLIYLNVAMVVFNLIPAFPLDGGRIFRAALASFLPRLRATRIAVNVGSVFAVLIALAGLLWWHSPMLAVIGLFVYMAGQQELRYLEYRERFGEPRPYTDPVTPAADVPPPWVRPRVRVDVWDPHTGQWVRNDAEQFTRG